MKKLLLLFIVFFSASPAFCQAKYWQQKTDYSIAVTLNDADNSLTGYEQINYLNNSPDTLHFIWIHLWPNAYKNDRTAFSDQLLQNGRTDFYFSAENKRGYINRLSFKVDNTNAVTEDHPQHQDIVKLLLPSPLAPGGSLKIETPFHVKLPYNFSRGGHVLQSYQITQWYPKPAVYDKNGWHEMPYLDQGEFYSEFGKFDVKITLPDNYVVAATGDLQDAKEKEWLKEKSFYRTSAAPKVAGKKIGTKEKTPAVTASSPQTKTLHYIQNNVHDFAWFADKDFLVKTDTMKLTSGSVIDLYAFVLPNDNDVWKNSISFIKRSVLSKSAWIGEYPYNVISVVDNAAMNGGGMEYPTITLLSSGGNEAALEAVINHEVGHNWFYGILATNERRYPWMDEGINSYYDKRYDASFADPSNKTILQKNKFLQKRVPRYPEENLLATVIKIKKDQPINTTSENFSAENYGLIAYEKAGEWLKLLENTLGKETFDKVMQAYYDQWKFKHPQPEDLKAIAEQVSRRSLDELFKELDTKGPLVKENEKQLKFTSFFNLKETGKYNYISALPALGYNFYDKLMIGAVIHNYNLPPTAFQFVAAPLYATGTKTLNGIGRMEYNWFPGSKGAKLTASVSGEKFTGDSFKDGAGKDNAQSFSKITPSLKYNFANSSPLSRAKKYIQFKTFLISETGLAFTHDNTTNTDVISYPKIHSYVKRLSLGVENTRVLYPYNAVLQADQGDGFVRIDLTADYFFNYESKGGLDVRLFAGKFIYTGDAGILNQFKTDRYQLNMTGPKGDEDYAYSNYFFGRNEFEGLGSKQIMKRDGFFKVRTDLLSNKIGKTDDWLTAVNLVSDIPIGTDLPRLPLKFQLFADIGTYAEAWQANATSGRLLYDAGIQLNLFRSLITIYAPLVYSKVYKDYSKSVFPKNRFANMISFSIDLQQLKLQQLLHL